MRASAMSQKLIVQPIIRLLRSDRCCQAAEAPLAALEIGDGRAQIVGAEIGPQRIDEAQLGVGRLPQQEVGQPLLAAGADDKVDVA